MEVVKLLLAHGADPDMNNIVGVSVVVLVEERVEKTGLSGQALIEAREVLGLLLQDAARGKW